MATISSWAPVGEAISLRDAIDRLVERSFLQPRGGDGAQTGRQALRMPVDVYETPHEFVIRGWAPGVKPDGLSITWNQGVVTISGTIPASEPSGERVVWHTRELHQGEVAASIALPGQFDVEKAEAAFDAGVLTLRIPKAESAQPKVIRVNATNP
ncbi:MAG TPA: Hsp20/alpha crystallin family protein [Dehalococcoidia bacterium]|jgi:HSP20 family protein